MPYGFRFALFDVNAQTFDPRGVRNLVWRVDLQAEALPECPTKATGGCKRFDHSADGLRVHDDPPTEFVQGWRNGGFKLAVNGVKRAICRDFLMAP